MSFDRKQLCFHATVQKMIKLFCFVFWFSLWFKFIWKSCKIKFQRYFLDPMYSRLRSWLVPLFKIIDKFAAWQQKWNKWKIVTIVLFHASKIMNSLQNNHKNYKILSIKYAKKLKNPDIHICIFITLLSFSVK